MKKFLIFLALFIPTVASAQVFKVNQMVATSTNTSYYGIPYSTDLGLGTSTFKATSSPMFGFITATTTTATSTFAGGVNITGGCLAISGGCLSLSGSGTVTSVSLTTPTGLTITGSPITTSGTLALTLSSGYVIPLTASTTQWNNLLNASTTLPYVTSIATNNGLTGGTITTSGTVGLDLTSISNNALLSFNGTRLSATGTPFLTAGAYIGTTTSTSTLAGGLQALILNTTSTTASSTFSNGINLTHGCLAIAGSCVTSGAGSPAGSNFQVQYNSSGSFGASSALTFNSSTGALTVGGGCETIITSNSPYNAIIGDVNGCGSGNTLQTDEGGGVMAFTGENGIYQNSSAIISLTAPQILLNGTVGISTSTPGTVFSIGTTNGINFDTAGTSTLPKGINILGGCYAINGSCSSGSGSGTVNSGVANQVAYYAANGTAVSGTSSLTILTDGTVHVGSVPGMTIMNDKFFDSNSNLCMSPDSVRTIVFCTNNTSGVTLGTTTSSVSNIFGKLGVSTTTPWAQLSVEGTSTLGNEALAGFFLGTTTATSTLTGGLSANLLNVTSSTATSTFQNGTNLNTGCYAIKGSCIGGSGGGGSGTVSSANGGQLAVYNNGGTTVGGTSTLNFINGNLGVGVSAPTIGGLEVSGGNSFTAIPNAVSAFGEINSSTGWNGEGFLFAGATNNAFSMVYTGAQAYFGNITNTTQQSWFTVNGTGLSIGTTNISNELSVNGGVEIGSYSGIAAPSNGLIISNSVGIGTTSPGTLLSVQGIANFDTATSTFEGTGGINLTSGCFSVKGSCIVSGSGVNYWTLTGTNLYDNRSTSNTPSGSNNFLEGEGAGSAITNGSNNILMGDDAGQSVQSATDNVILGDTSGIDLISGVRNVFLGLEAGEQTTGSDNIFAGWGAGSGATTGSANLSLGISSGSSIGNGANNVFLGEEAGDGMAGSYNTFVGGHAGAGAISGSDNIVLGNGSDLPNSSGSNQLNIGNLIYGLGTYSGSGSSSAVPTMGQIGLGTTTPTASFVIESASSTVPTTSYNGLIEIVSGLENTTLKLFQEIDQWGHIITSGDAPTVSGGTSSVSGNDRNGNITVTGTALTSVTLTFAHPWASAPDCTESDNQTASVGDISSISTTQIVFNFSVGVNSAHIWYICQAHQ
jgi:hypothetical protein